MLTIAEYNKGILINEVAVRKKDGTLFIDFQLTNSVTFEKKI